MVINSLLIGFLFSKWLINRKQNNALSHKSSVRNRFKGLRNSLKARKNNFDKRDSLRNVRNSLRSRSRELRDSIRSKGSQITRKISGKVPTNPKLTKELEKLGSSSSLNSRVNVDTNVGTNTDINWQLPPYVHELYPALPGYT